MTVDIPLVLKRIAVACLVLAGIFVCVLFRTSSPMLLYRVPCSPAPCIAYREVVVGRYMIVASRFGYFVWPESALVKYTGGRPLELGLFALADGRAPQVTIQPKGIKMPGDPKFQREASIFSFTDLSGTRITVGR